MKIISGEKLVEMNYHQSVERELSILQMLTHPGVCRVVSSFRYTSSAYIVLEYCARGDLHSYIIKCGAGIGLPQQLTRFVLGEICAGLLAVHELGFSFNDLKPENILITQLGHVKLADFGGCRACR